MWAMSHPRWGVRHSGGSAAAVARADLRHEALPVRGRLAAGHLGIELLEVPVPSHRDVDDVGPGGEDLDEAQDRPPTLGPQVEVDQPSLAVLLHPLDNEPTGRGALDDGHGLADRLTLLVRHGEGATAADRALAVVDADPAGQPDRLRQRRPTGPHRIRPPRGGTQPPP